jgi:hypothetical protein
MALTTSRCRDTFTTVGEQTEGNRDHRQDDESSAATEFRQLKIDDTTDKNVHTEAPPKPILVLNFASDTAPGGRWREGVLGQEEELFYRTSLSRSLNPAYYPLKLLNSIYSPKVFLIRGPYKTGHQLCFSSSLASTPPPNSPLAQKISEFFQGRVARIFKADRPRCKAWSILSR